MESLYIDCEDHLRQYLGAQLLDDFVQAMLDHATPAIYFPPEAGILLDLHDQALDAIREGLSGEADETVTAIQARMPSYYESTELAAALLALGTHDRFFEIPESVFDPPASDSRVLTQVPSLDDRIDEDGLVDCTGLEATNRLLIIDGLGIQYHQLLRRHFSSNINDRLISTLLTVASRPGNTLRLAIDDRRIAPAAEVLHMFEADYWWGPPLTEDWLDDPHKVGRTVHEDPDGDESLQGFKGFEVHWRMANDDSEKVVQMEELVATSQEKVCDYRLLRYLHAIRDIDSHTFIHCDGAVRAYDDNAFEKRQQGEIARTVQANKYRKVFRIDGSISTSEWSDIVAKWFRHNQLVTEYLSTLAVAEPN